MFISTRIDQGPILIYSNIKINSYIPLITECDLQNSIWIDFSQWLLLKQSFSYVKYYMMYSVCDSIYIKTFYPTSTFE